MKNIPAMKTNKSVCFFFVFLFFGVLFPSLGLANNVTISNISLTEQDTENGTVKIEFDISWSNSWRNSVNYDAVWVFAQYNNASGFWSPVAQYNPDLVHGANTPTGWSVGTGTPLEFNVDVTNSYGFILQRSGDGSGDVDTDNIQFIWDWGSEGLTADTSKQVKVFAIEMVYVPGTEFDIGDGNSTSESTNAFHTKTTTVKYTVMTSVSYLATVTANTYDDSQLESTGVGVGYGGLDANGDLTVDNTNFPTAGAYAPYIMKYEISQGQYVGFLNSLDSTSQTNRYPGQNGNFRHTISCSLGTCSYNSRADRACNYLSWMDVCAFCDWAGMRPMTEVEFEAVARGPTEIRPAIYGEYVWGSTSYVYAQTISGTENGTETISYPQNANVNSENLGFSGGDASYGPLRSGIFATSTSNRETAGASYYGIMELSGNLYEQCVTIGEISGRAFTGSHGDGELAIISGSIGTATNTDWPGYSYSDSGVSGGSGAGVRGGSWSDLSTALRTSDRAYGAYPYITRQPNNGGRCARTDPRDIPYPY